MKLLRTLLLLALVAALLGVAVWQFTRPPLPAVTMHVVATGVVEATVANTRAGTIQAERRAKLAPATGGQVHRLHVREGDRVEADQVLLELWSEDLQAQLELTRRQVAQSEALAESARLRAELAEREAARMQQLKQEQIISEDAIDKVRSGAQAARADQVAAAAQAKVRQAEIATIEAALQRTIVTAPFAGVVAEVNGEVGEFVTPSPVGIPTPPAVDLIDDSKLYASAPIDEVDAAAVRVGMDVRITLDAFGKRPFAGRVRRIAPYVLDREKQARTTDVEVDFVELPEDVHLLAGYSADVEILLQTRAGVLRVPTAAVREGDVVLLLRDDDTVEQRHIERGLANWRFVEVRSGLQAGDRIVLTSDQADIEDGAPVTVRSVARDEP